MRSNCGPGYNTLIVRLARFRLRRLTPEGRQVETVADHLVVNYSYSQVRDVLRGRHFHTVGAFATATCSCKSKSQIVTNFALPAALSHIEKSGHGVHAVAPCAPSLGLALTGRVMFNDEGREGNTLEDLINMNLLPDGCNLRQRSVVHDLLQFWAPSVKLPEIHAALANRGGGLKGRLCRLKSTIYAGMALAAKTRPRKKIPEEGWSRGITPEWIEITSSLKKRWCNGVARYTILRWAVNQDDDVWLANRGTRHSQQCSQCSSKGDSFPGGHTLSPWCERCIQAQQVTPVKNCPFGDALLQTCYQ